VVDAGYFSIEDAQHLGRGIALTAVAAGEYCISKHVKVKTHLKIDGLDPLRRSISCCEVVSNV
jgi:hypothetical protein